MMNLIAYRLRHITPMQYDWLRSLSDVVDKYFVYVHIYESVYYYCVSDSFMYSLTFMLHGHK